jgi:hypothetical protein
MATLLRAFAREGDRLWLPGEVSPERIAPVPGLPAVVLASGEPRPAPEILAWCETPEAAALRTRPRTMGVPLGSLLHEILWHMPVPRAEAVAAVHHRAFHLRVAEELGCSLPGARMLSSMTELNDVAAPSWVVKAPLSASGRSRYIERAGPALSDPKARRTVERLFEVHGELLFEPWMDRTEDFGCALLLTPDGYHLASFHRQIVDLKGQFLGLELAADFRGIEGLSAAERTRLETVLDGVAGAALRVGYVGPLGIDLWRYRLPDRPSDRHPDGSTALNPLGEINARMTFGLVARALVDRARGALGEAERVRLMFGKDLPGEGVVPLLLPPGGAVWLQPVR